MAIATIPSHPGYPEEKARVESGDSPLAALARAMETCPDKMFLDFEGDYHSFRSFDSATSRLAAGLKALGVQPGEPVSAMLDNNVDCLRMWFALNKIGAIWVPVNTALRRDFLSSQLVDTGCALIVCEDHYVERIEELADTLPNVRRLLVRGGPSAGTVGGIAVEPLEPLYDYAPLTDLILPDPADICCVLYTSGTTGPSKGCMISHNYLSNQTVQVVTTTPVYPDDVLWTSMPLFHIGAITGSFLPALLLKERASLASRFSVSGFWPEIERSGARVATVLASMIPLLAAAPDNDATIRCRGQIHSLWGLPFTAETRKVWHDRFGVKWINSYGFGQTEGGKIITVLPGEPLPPEGSQGRLAEEFEAKIVDDQDCEVSPGVVGEIVFRPRRPNIMFSGYWKRPEATVAAWRNLWMHSGDQGKFDADGWFYFVGRKKDSIRRRGENISTFECEQVFTKHPALKEAVVHAVASPLGEDDVKVTAIVREDAILTEEELARWCIDQFPYFAVPRYYEFRDDIPRTSTGKPLKYVLQEEGCTPGTWDMEKSGIVPARRGRA